MYSMVIADDDVWIRKGLIDMIDWEQYDINKVYEAENGQEALELITRHTIDILITDVRMPDLDGLELTKQIQDKHFQTKVIIISGYQYFEYAKKALMHGACNYILKPVNGEEIIKQVQQCICIMKQEKDRKQEKDNLLKLWDENVALVCKQSITHLFNNGSSDEMLNKLELCGLSFKKQRTVILGMQLELSIEEGTKVEWEREKFIKQRLEVKINEWMLTHQRIGMVGIVEEDVVYGCLELNDEEILTDIAEKFKRLCQQLIDGNTYKITIGFSEIFSNFDDWYLGKEQVKWALKRQFFEPEKYILVFKHREASTDGQITYNLYRNKEKLLLNCIVSNEKNELIRIFHEIYTHMLEYKDQLSPDDAKYIYNRIMDNLHMQLFNKTFIITDQLEKIKTLESLNNYIVNITNQWIGRYHKNNKKITQHVVRDIMNYLEENYNKKIDLQSCADHFYMSPAYLSNLFSKKTGETFINYIKKVRIKHAKEILNETNFKIYEVAQMVGYKDEKYFTKIFKENEGITPKKYRDKIY